MTTTSGSGVATKSRIPASFRKTMRPNATTATSNESTPNPPNT